MSITLTSRAKNLLINDKGVHIKIGKAIKETPLTVQAWVQRDNPLIVQPAAIEVIRNAYDLTDKEILTQL